MDHEDHSVMNSWNELSGWTSGTTWWLIPLSKWVITLVISGPIPLIPFITRVITHLLSGMSHQVQSHILGDEQLFTSFFFFNETSSPGKGPSTRPQRSRLFCALFLLRLCQKLSVGVTVFVSPVVSVPGGPVVIHDWLVVWNIFYFSIYWEQSSQLTFIFFRGVAQPPTRWWISIFPALATIFLGTIYGNHRNTGVSRMVTSPAAKTWKFQHQLVKQTGYDVHPWFWMVLANAQM